MNINIRHILFLCILFFSAQHTEAQIENNLREEIETIIHYETNIDDDRVQGYVIGVIIEDESYYFTFGDPDFIQSHNLSEKSIFEIGALTNVFTALTTVEAGTAFDIDLKKDFCEYLAVPKEANKGVTVENLLTHTSGFPYRPAGFGKNELDSRNPFAYYTKKDLIQYIENFKPAGIGKYLYSNLNYAIVELLLEHVAKQPFPQIFRELVLEKLPLTNTKFDGPLTSIFPGQNLQGTYSKPWTYQTFEGAVGLKSNLIDLAEFARCNFEGYNGPLSKSFREIRKMRIETNITENTKVGFGWHGVQFKKYHPLIALGGVTSGHSSFMAIVPKTRTAVIILAAGPYELDGLGFLILRMINNNWKISRR